MKRYSIIAVACLAACSGDSGIDTRTWTCENLIPHVIEMSRDRTPGVLEISQPRQMGGGPGQDHIGCQGFAEWSQGGGMIEYGARISDGGQVILGYRQL